MQGVGLQSDQGHGAMVAPGQRATFALVSSLFFMWGIPSNLNDVLIRQFMKSFTLTRVEAGLVQLAFYLGYFCFAIPAALLMERRGYRTGLVAGLLLFAAGAVLFWPAAIVGRYGFFLAALFVIAAGLSFLETAANSFVAQMGPPASAARRLNLAQAFNTLGSIAGVLAGTLFIFSGIELSAPDAAAMAAAGTYAAYLHRETMRVVMPYLALALFACALALVFLRIRLPATGEGVDASRAGSSRALLHSRHLLFAVTAQFLYVGAQVGTWSWFIQYVEQYAGQPERHAGLLLTGTLAAFAVGRFSAPAIMRRVPAAELMLVYALINAALLAFAVLRPGWGGVGAVFLTSFFMSIMYPTIFALGVEGLGVHVKLGGAVLVMAIIGGAALPPVMAWISERSSIAMAYLAPLLCYLGVAAFARYHLGHGGAANAAGAASVGA